MSESSISDTEILRILYSHNPWWANRPIPKSKLTFVDKGMLRNSQKHVHKYLLAIVKA